MSSQVTRQLEAALAALPDAGALLADVFARSPVATAIYGSDGRLVLCNDACRGLFGSELPSGYDVRSDEILARCGVLPDLERAWRGETVTLPVLWYDARELETLGITEGRRVAISTTLVPRKSDDGSVRFVIATFRDETETVLARERMAVENAARERMRAETDYAERELRQSREQIHLILDSAPVGIAYFDPDERHVFVNSRYAERVGRQPGQLQALTLREAWGDAIYGVVRPQLERSWAGEAREFEVRVPDRDGSVAYVHVSHAPDFDDAGRVRGLVVVLSDMTELRLDEENLRASRLHLESSQRIAHVGSWELDLRGFSEEEDRAMLCSDECYRIFGFAPGEVSPTLTFFAGCIHPDDRQQILEAVRAAILQGRAYSVEYRVIRPDGTERVVYTRAERIVDGETGEPRCLIGTTQDVTERVAFRREIERLNHGLELRVAERTAQLAAANRELEAFAYSVSHDLRAPLRGINGFAHLLVSEYGDSLPEEAGHYLNRVFESARRMGTLIDNLLDFSRLGQAALQMGSVDTRAMVEEVCEELVEGMPDGAVEITIGDLPVCLADPALLRQVFANLVGNAIKFSREREPARIEIDCIEEGGREVWCVRDNGIGFDMARANDIFEVFHRLHPAGKYEGAGVGLAIVKRIVLLHGGTIRAEAAPGEGAVFRFTLAAAKSAEAAA